MLFSEKPLLQRGIMNFAETHYLILSIDGTKHASRNDLNLTLRLIISTITICIKNKKENMAASE